MNKLYFFAVIMILSMSSDAQTGCRRNSDGILFQNRIILSTDYNANSPGPDASAMCLPPGVPGTNCTIRIPFSLTTFPGTFGSYSVINCDLDAYTAVAISIAGFIGIMRIRKRL